MDIPEPLKKSPVLIGGAVVVFIIIIMLAKKGGSGQTQSSGTDNSAALATQSANVQIAGINADLQKEQIRASSEVTLGSYARDVSLANIVAQTQVAGAKITSDENITLTGLDYSHDIANRQLEDNRVLGLTQEDTKRLLGTQENQTRLTLGITQIDANRYIAERAIHSDEVKQARVIDLAGRSLDSQERIADFTTSRALTYEQISGANQVAAAKAAKPSWFQSLMSGLGGVAQIASVFVNPAAALIPKPKAP